MIRAVVGFIGGGLFLCLNAFRHAAFSRCLIVFRSLEFSCCLIHRLLAVRVSEACL